MSNRQPTEESFLKDVSGHQMTVLHDDDLYRHVRFGRPDSGNMSFYLTTWLGYLCYSGDMGCYVFTRIPDMFEFFRGRSSADGEGRYYINPDYWSQKVESIDRCSDIEEYRPEKFRAAIQRYLGLHFEDIEGGAPQDLREAIEDQVLCHADQEHEARRAAYYFDHEGFTFQDFYESDVKDYTYRFLWCCYAVAWAVRQWDDHKAAEMRASAGCHAPGGLDEIMTPEEVRAAVRQLPAEVAPDA